MLLCRPFAVIHQFRATGFSKASTTFISRNAISSSRQQSRSSIHSRCRCRALFAMDSSALPGLLVTCCLMFGGAYGCGMLPSLMPVKHRVSSHVSAVGAGLLLGSALCIILPEGFEASEGELPTWATSLALLSGFWVMMMLDSLSHWLPSSGSSSRSQLYPRSFSDAGDCPEAAADNNSMALHVLPISDPSGIASSAAAAGARTKAGADDSSDEHVVLLSDFAQQTGAGAGAAAGKSTLYNNSSSCTTPTKSRASARAASASGTANTAAAAAGAISDSSSLPAGSSVRRVVSGGGSGTFLAPSSATPAGGNFPQAAAPAPALPGRALAAAKSSSSSLGGTSCCGAEGGPSTDLPGRSRGGTSSSTGKQSAGKDLAVLSRSWWQSWLRDPTCQALLGLLVHAVSDGLAVGAASLSRVPEVSLGVATAMVVHKGPVAIGLATYLRGAMWTPAQVHRGVLLFAAASPIAAMLTYALISAVPGLASNVPLVVLFSGGTVLYAASMHILPSAARNSSKASHHHSHGATLDRSQLIMVTIGMLLPWVLTAIFHGHHHHDH